MQATDAGTRTVSYTHLDVYKRQITEASIKLGTTSDKIEVEVIEKGSTGFLGIKSKPAIIKARKKNDTVDNIREFLENV